MDSDKAKTDVKTATKETPETGAAKKAARRKVLRNTLIGGAVISTASVPEKWRKPALEAVMLPAHAATTDDTGSGSGGATTAAPTTAPTTTAAPTTTCDPSSNACMVFNFSSWTDPIA